MESDDDYRPMPALKILDYNEPKMVSKLVQSIESRIECSDRVNEESLMTEGNFRKKLMHYERRNVEALGKLRVLEPQLALSEAEFEKVAREVDKVERKNRAMLETARHYERQRVELQRELGEKSNYLKQTDAHKRRAELESKRNIEDHQRKLQMDTERQIAETKTTAARKISAKDEKLSKLKSILDKQPQPHHQLPLTSPKPVTPTMSSRGHHRRSNSESGLAEPSVVQSTPTKMASTSNLRKKTSRTMKPVYHGSLESIVNPRALTNQRYSNSSLRGSIKQNRLDIELNPRNENTEMIQKRRPSSADGRRWLAHTPNDTIHTNTVLQNSIMLQPEHIRKSSSLITKFKAKLSLIKPTISANKRVHRPSEADLKKSDRYLLTHQEQGDNNQLRTTIVKGDIVDTKMGGIQVKFTGKERLTTASVNERGQCSTTSFINDSDESMTSENSAFTDIATRCNMAVVHKKGADIAEAINVSQSKMLVRDMNASCTSIRIVDNRELDSSFQSDYL